MNQQRAIKKIIIPIKYLHRSKIDEPNKILGNQSYIKIKVKTSFYFSMKSTTLFTEIKGYKYIYISTEFHPVVGLFSRKYYV